MTKLVLVRHGQSEWNLENRFTGWVDVDLSQRGISEAREAGAALRDQGFRFDITMTSYLKRSIRTLWLILETIDQMYLPVQTDWRLGGRNASARRRHGARSIRVARYRGGPLGSCTCRF